MRFRASTSTRSRLTMTSTSPVDAINGSMFNKIVLRTGLQQPFPISERTVSPDNSCLAFSKSTVIQSESDSSSQLAQCNADSIPSRDCGISRQ
jgi:hypothetical protein